MLQVVYSDKRSSESPRPKGRKESPGPKGRKEKIIRRLLVGGFIFNEIFLEPDFGFS
jgi:hypothetical protein